MMAIFISGHVRSSGISNLIAVGAKRHNIITYETNAHLQTQKGRKRFTPSLTVEEGDDAVVCFYRDWPNDSRFTNQWKLSQRPHRPRRPPSLKKSANFDEKRQVRRNPQSWPLTGRIKDQLNTTNRSEIKIHAIENHVKLSI